MTVNASTDSGKITFTESAVMKTRQSEIRERHEMEGRGRGESLQVTFYQETTVKM